MDDENKNKTEETCYNIGFKHGLDRTKADPKDCIWSFKTYESYSNGYRDSMILKDILIEMYRRN